MPIQTQHPQYAAHKLQWQKCRDCYEGEDAVKEAGILYLPKLSIVQTVSEYASYKARGYFYEVVPRTISGLVGAATRKRATIEGPDEIVEMATPNIIREIIRELLITGRCSLLVDMPLVPSDRSYLAVRTAEQVINWRDEDGKLILVVMSETREAVNPQDEYDIKVETWFRELKIEGGQYVINLYRPKGDSVWELAETITPRASNKNLGFIPFTFTTPRGITETITQPPILGLANANLWHYRHSADYSHGLHYTGLPTPWVSGHNTKVDEDGGIINDLQIGSGTAWLLEAGGSAGYLEFTGQGLTALQQALADMESRMALIGARLLESSKRAAEAAETVRLRQSAESATLINVVTAAGDALEQALTQAAQWLGLSQEVSVEMNTDFVSDRLEAADIIALIQALQVGGMSLDTFIYNLAAGEILPPDRTVEDEKLLIADGQVPV
uniref:DUF4055 domain-containing protein n=1 Tax=viral metagenome TaxID=1070528 RepID=A0A6M3L1G9_9ZZZZ